MQKMMVHFWQSGEKPSQEVLECFMKGTSMCTQGSNVGASKDGSHGISIQESEEQSGQETHCEQPAQEKIPPRDEPPSGQQCPRQPVGSVLCGYYVCRYMLDLIKARYVNITPNFMLTAPPSYTVDQIDEVRNI